MGKVLGITFVALAVLFGGVWVASRGTDTTATDAEAHKLANDLSNSLAANGDAAAQAAAAAQATAPQGTNTITSPDTKKVMYATLHTNQGDIKIEFMGADAPNTVANFAKLAGEGFYNGVKFHRVIKGFMIQGGDPLSKDDAMQARWGTGGPGYTFADEIHANNHNNIGTIAMANAGPGTNGSQFFINVANNNFLDGKHTVFGKVVSGMEIVTKIENTKTSENDRPVTPMVIESVTVE